MEKKYNEDNIRALSPQEAVRKLPTLYFEKLFKAGSLNALPIEVACHAIDEYYDKNCSKIEIIIDEKRFAIKYDAGMSLSPHGDSVLAVAFMTSIFTCRNHKKHLSVGAEFCELGIATVNFGSKRSTLKTVWKNQLGHFDFEEGLLVNSVLEENLNREEYTEISFEPDPSIFGDLTLSIEGVNALVDSIRMKLPDLTIVVSAA